MSNILRTRRAGDRSGYLQVSFSFSWRPSRNLNVEQLHGAALRWQLSWKAGSSVRGWDGVVGAAEMLGVFGAILIVQYTQQVTTSYKKKGG